MLTVGDWIAIRELARQGVAQTEIARRTGRDPKTIRKVLRAAGPRARASTWRPEQHKLAPYTAYLEGRIAQGCLNASVLCEEITRQGYPGKITRVRDFVRPIRQEVRRSREATVRFETGPGKQAQVDWGHFGTIWDRGLQRRVKLYAFVFTLGYSRAQYLEFVTRCDLEHFLACHLHAFAALGIPEQMLDDNLKTVALDRDAEGRPVLQTQFADFALAHGFTPKLCQPYRARTKGKVERGIGYVRQNFWVRVAAEVASGELELDGLNERGAAWVATVANVRVHGTHGEGVGERLAVEHPLLGSLQARPRYAVAYRSARRVGRDGRLSYRGQLYQVPLPAALTTVEVVETLAGEVTVRTSAGEVLGCEPVVVGRTLTMLAERAAGAPAPTERGLGEGAAVAVGHLHLLPPDHPAPVVEVRPLAVYQEVLDAAGDA